MDIKGTAGKNSEINMLLETGENVALFFTDIKLNYFLQLRAKQNLQITWIFNWGEF